MSNVTTAINFLKEKLDLRFLAITTVDTNKIVGLAQVYLKDIPNEDLVAYIKTNLGQFNYPIVVGVECREYAGVTHRKKGAFSLQILPDGYQAPTTQNTPVQEMEPIVHKTEPIKTDYPNNQGSLGMVAVPISEVMNSHKNESKVEVLREKIDDLKEDKSELKEKIRRLQKKFDDLDTDSRNLKSELSIATAQKDMAVMIAKTENKSFFEHINFDKIIDKAPALMAQMAAMKHGIAPAVEGALSAPGVSEDDDRNELYEYLEKNLNDEELQLLASTAGQFKKVGFVQQLSQLITQFNGI